MTPLKKGNELPKAPGLYILFLWPMNILQLSYHLRTSIVTSSFTNIYKLLNFIPINSCYPTYLIKRFFPVHHQHKMKHLFLLY